MAKKIIDVYYDEKKGIYKENFKSKFRQFVIWVNDNKELIVMCAPVVLATCKFGSKLIVKVGKNINLRKAEKIKNLYCYDPSLGHYWELKRKLSNKEWLSIDSRKKNGERLADILSELKVLK